jgi:hypothetical protein
MYIIQLKKYRKRALWRVIVVRRIALKWIQYMEVWNCCVSFRTGSSDRLLWRLKWTFKFDKLWRISWLASQLFASEERLCSMMWLISFSPLSNYLLSKCIKCIFPGELYVDSATAPQTLLISEQLESIIIFAYSQNHWSPSWYFTKSICRLCCLVIRVSGYRPRGPGFDSRR